MNNCAFIGGTGLNQLDQFELVQEHALDTPFGAPSAAVQEGRFAGHHIWFLPRHGTPHRLPPHKINYRANLWLLRELGVGQVVAVNAVGGVNTRLKPGALIVPDQIIDYTWGREHSYYDGLREGLEHIDFSQPYHRGARSQLLQAARDCKIACVDGGTYGATQGPRLETAAEVRRLQQDGCDIVGMTGMPEAALAAELGLSYAAICLVVNAAAGLQQEPITLAAMDAVLKQGIPSVGEILAGFLPGCL